MAEHSGKAVPAKAMVMFEKGGELRPTDIFCDPPKAGEVRLRVLSCGVCHTDWIEPRSFPASKKPDGPLGAEGFPQVHGHEGAGIVLDVGPGVSEFAAGDYVVPLYTPTCGSCQNCLKTGARRTNQCTATEHTGGATLPDGTTRLWMQTDKGRQDILHFMNVSCFSSVTVVSTLHLCKVSKEANLDKCGILGCGVSTGIGAVLNDAKVESNTSVAVFGCGVVGCAVISAAAKLAGAKRVIAVDLNAKREEAAKSFGATHFICSAGMERPQDAVWNANECDGDQGVDYVFDCTGNTKAMMGAIECTAWGSGTFCVIGVAPAGEQLEITPVCLVGGKRLIGSAFGNFKKQDVPQLVDASIRGRVPLVDKFIGTSVFPYTAVDDCFNKAKDGSVLKAVVTFPHDGDAEVAAHRAAHQPGAIIFLHGVGDCGASWDGTAEYISKTLNRETQWKCPDAPMREITKNITENPAERFLTAWFDVAKPWPWTPDRTGVLDGLDASVASVHQMIDNYIAAGVPAERILVAGFSQGAVVATNAVYSYGKARLGGCAALSGWLPATMTKIEEANKATPFASFHGGKDEIVSIACQAHAVEGLKALGAANVKSFTYADLGHDTSEQEFEGDIIPFVQGCLPTKV